MEDIKNINTSKAKYQAGVTARENKRRNRKPTSFFEFFTIDLTKTPAGRARAKTEEKSKKKLDSAIRDAGTKRNIQEVISSSEKAANLSKSTKAYRIKKGDTLSAIAARNDTTVAELKKLNNIKIC